MAHGANPDTEDASGKSARDLDPKFFTKHYKAPDIESNAQEIPGQHSSNKRGTLSRRSSMERLFYGSKTRGQPDWMDKFTDQPIPKLANPYSWNSTQKANGNTTGSDTKRVQQAKGSVTEDDANLLCDEELDAILNDIDVAQANIHGNDRRNSIPKQASHPLQGKVSKEINKLKEEMDDVTKLLEEFSNEELGV